MLITNETPLSVNLRECTAAAHGHAERTPFMSRLVEGTLTRGAVADYTGQLWFIYTALEWAVRTHAHLPRLATIADTRLERLDALERDLVELIGPGWRSELVAGPGTVAYVQRLDELADKGDQLGLIAHHYVRYLGDLAGGQVIARMLRQRYGIGEGGVNFYDFSRIGKIKPYRDGYRDRLDALGLDGPETVWLVSEANQAFDLNSGVFRDLAERHCRVTESL